MNDLKEFWETTFDEEIPNKTSWQESNSYNPLVNWHTVAERKLNELLDIHLTQWRKDGIWLLFLDNTSATECTLYVQLTEITADQRQYIDSIKNELQLATENHLTFTITKIEIILNCEGGDSSLEKDIKRARHPPHLIRRNVKCSK
jgi:hypothetical protein